MHQILAAQWLIISLLRRLLVRIVLPRVLFPDSSRRIATIRRSTTRKNSLNFSTLEARQLMA